MGGINIALAIPMNLRIALLAFGLVTTPAAVFAFNIKVIDSGVSGHGMVINAKNQLTALGNTVTAGGTLSDYSAFDQVWDLRYTGNLTAADITAMGSFLQSGGSMFLTGEHSGFNTSRNNSLVSFISGVGGGSITLSNGDVAGPQAITAAGQIVNSPNTFTSVAFSAANTVGATSTGNGFQVTALGSLLGWDFGDIAGSPNARMLVGFDIEMFQASNGEAWTENMVTYLDGPSSVPDSGSTVALVGVAMLGLVSVRRRYFSA
jgi:hypothetical protein